MIISVPRETHRHEHRVGLSPFAVSRLIKQGHTVLIEREAGKGAHFTDQVYQKVGGQIVYSSDEVYKRAQLVCRVGTISAEELELLSPDTTICAFHHLAVASKEMIRQLQELRTTLIGYEIVQDEKKRLPILLPFSEMAGHMSVHVAAGYLQTEMGGRGILMGNVPGVPPPTVLILGAGTVGSMAACQALASGAHVIVFDASLPKLRHLNNRLSGRAVTMVPTAARLAQYSAIADVLIGAVLIPGGRAPYLITEEMVRAMKPGSVILDIAIDQGGCVETSRPTTLDQPTFKMHDVIHFCVPNMTANVARTASRALANEVLPFIQNLANLGVDGALWEDVGLGRGVYLYRGEMVNEGIGKAMNIPVKNLRDLLPGDGVS